MQILNGFTISEKMQENKYYTIYRAQRHSDNLKVILKICSDQLNVADLANLQHEYQILKQLNLNGIIQVYDLIKVNEKLVLVLEDMEGISLRSFLKIEQVDLNVFFKIALQLVDAMGELHLQNIIHKDINPDNILINLNTHKVKLADFSISTRLTQETQESISLKNLEGTLAYISPEQTGRMNRSLDYRTDFYSLGVTFYEILTGHVPFSTQDVMELIHNHLTKIPESASMINTAIPSVIGEIISKLLAKVPEARYASAAGLKADLMECKKHWEIDKQIKSFTLGKRDIKDHLIISQKLYGRENEVEQILTTFERICQGRTELIFISGYSRNR